MARIWMNHWFSTAYNIITLIKEGIPDASIIGSNEHAASPIMKVCDEWYQEPVLKGEQYVSFCLDFCTLKMFSNLINFSNWCASYSLFKRRS